MPAGGVPLVVVGGSRRSGPIGAGRTAAQESNAELGMPTYEYRCASCGHEFERFQKISDEPVRECPACGEAAAERRISAGGGVVFKGSGFYATDYRKEPPRKEGEAGGKKGSASGDGKDSAGTGGTGGKDS